MGKTTDGLARNLCNNLGVVVLPRMGGIRVLSVTCLVSFCLRVRTFQNLYE